MSQKREEFDVNTAIQRANEMLAYMGNADDGEGTRDTNLILATTIQKLVGAA